MYSIQFIYIQKNIDDHILHISGQGKRKGVSFLFNQGKNIGR
jgi:hypothetical protein